MPTGPPRLRTPDGRLNRVGLQVRARRKEMKLTQDHLCGRLATASEGQWAPQWRDIVRIERGSRLVSDLELFVLAAALECTVQSLLADNMNE